MRRKSALLAVVWASAILAACGPVPRPVTPSLQSPSREWKVTLQQSGGFIGVLLTIAVDSSGQMQAEDVRAGRSVTRQLSTQDLAALRQLVGKLGSTDATPLPSACADCFIYDLELTSPGHVSRFHADDLTLSSSTAGALITYLTQLRDVALRVQN